MPRPLHCSPSMPSFPLCQRDSYTPLKAQPNVTSSSGFPWSLGHPST